MNSEIGWNKLKQIKKDLILRAAEKLAENEQQLLGRVLEFEIEHRHLTTMSYKKELREIVEQVIRDDS